MHKLRKQNQESKGNLSVIPNLFCVAAVKHQTTKETG